MSATKRRDVGAATPLPVRTRLLWTPPLDFATFRRQETVQLALSVAVMASLVLLHRVYRPVLGDLPRNVGIAFAARAAMQAAEAAFLNHPRTALGPRATWWYARLSIAVGIAFIALISELGSGFESHYAVLMVVPTIAAAFRLSAVGLVSTVAVIVGLTVGALWSTPWSPSATNAYLAETFEATTVSLIFVVVAAVVRLVARELWRREAALRQTVDDLAATRDRLVREEKLAVVGRLASAVAHEVRNPVSMIASAVAIARRPGTATEVRAEVFDILAHESRRLERLTEDFLAYARHRPPQLCPTSLGEALGLVAGLVRPRADELGVTLHVDAADAPVLADPFQLQQALLNLALNGLDATPRGGALRLSARTTPGRAVFAVENTGPALAADVVARLGEPFFTTKPRGTGLGVAIARSIAEAHRGEVVLAENAPGRVRFELSIGTAEQAVA